MGRPECNLQGHQNVTGTGGKGGISHPTSVGLALAKWHCENLSGLHSHALPLWGRQQVNRPHPSLLFFRRRAVSDRCGSAALTLEGGPGVA